MNDETAEFATLRDLLYTAVIGDVLDSLGRTHQFLPAAIQAIVPGTKLVGRAMPVLISDVFGTPARPFGLLTEALDQLGPAEIYLARSGRIPCAAWGELLTATARMRGASGAVIDGYHRDTSGILAQDFPVFSRGAYGQDAGPRAAVADYRVDIEIGGVHVQPGDLVFGDIDGVVIIPQDVETEILQRALDKASTENLVRQAIEAGMSSTEAFATYGVL